MSDLESLNSAASSNPSPRPSDGLSDDLPPVQPPSAGFIVQLFVVPGLIVLAVVAVWALFGRIAAGDQDWHRLVLELQSPNPHIRKRAMYGLSQVLDQDRRRQDLAKRAAIEGTSTVGTNADPVVTRPLSANPEIAQPLAEQLIKELNLGASDVETVKMQQFLTRSLGWLDLSLMADDVRSPASSIESRDRKSSVITAVSARKAVVDALKLALQPTCDIEIRKSAAASIAFVAARAVEQGSELDSPDLVEALIEATTDTEDVIRHATTYSLGFFRTPDAVQQLNVLVEGNDVMTRINAAIALTRSGSTVGLAVFKQALIEPVPSDVARRAEYFTIQKNALKAIADLAPKISDADKVEFREIISKLLKTHPEVRIRVDGQNALNALK